MNLEVKRRRTTGQPVPLRLPDDMTVRHYVAYAEPEPSGYRPMYAACGKRAEHIAWAADGDRRLPKYKSTCPGCAAATAA